ncbi:MAG: hypothetical protein JWM12_1751 [Ilumatobacteraceae bacterium]|nr:hypothetical protein [Ilumatobacteraceae bacterium]
MEQQQVEAAADEALPIPDRVLRSALEFAVDMAAAGAKLRPPLPSPDALRPFLRLQRLPSSAFARVRRAVEDDPPFLARLADVATPELVDDIGLAWLRRQPGWRSTIDELLVGRMGNAPDRLAADRREQRRRQAAEDAAAKARAVNAATQEQLNRERAAREHEQAERRRLIDELRIAQTRLGELESTVATLREQANRAKAAAEDAEAATARAVARADSAEAARDAVLAARVEALTAPPAPFDTEELRRSHAHALRGVHEAERAMRELGRALADLRSETPEASPDRTVRVRRPRSRRSPLPIPGGLYGHSAAVAEHLLRVPGVVALVDGYNVAKLGWPTLDLVGQREQCILVCENIARRWGTAITIVFDGADVVGTSAPRRLVRVAFSPPGVIADDVLRAEVAVADHRQPIVVVTNDQAVIADVRAEGANTLSSDQFLAVARH